MSLSSLLPSPLAVKPAFLAQGQTIKPECPDYVQSLKYVVFQPVHTWWVISSLIFVCLNKTGKHDDSSRAHHWSNARKNQEGELHRHRLCAIRHVRGQQHHELAGQLPGRCGAAAKHHTLTVRRIMGQAIADVRTAMQYQVCRHVYSMCVLPAT